MSDERSCPTCSGALPPDAPEGACPKCLLAAGFESADGGATGPAPDLTEVAAQFPELEIVEELGRGGMGVVYKARQKRLDRFVALKVLPREIAESAPDAARFEDRFTREARALARLSHRNIVAVHEFGERDGMYFFLMEYVNGANLRQAMRAGRLSPAEALAIVPQICDALQYAHDQGVVHRDIKPENVLLDQAGNVKIADFGLAKLVTRAVDDRTLTQQGLVMGTPHYMAPEQFEKPSEVDHRADIYSLGVVLYEMLTGELPIGRFSPPSEKVRMDVRLDEVVLRSLEKDADRRYQAVSDVKTGIGAVDVSADAGTEPDRGHPVRAGSRHSRLAFWGLMLPIVAIGGGVLLAFVGTFLLRSSGGMNPTWRAGIPVWILAALVGLAVLLGMVFSVAGIVQIRKSGGKLHGMGLAICGLLLPFLCCLPGIGVPMLWMSADTSLQPQPAMYSYDGIVPLEPIRPEQVDLESVDDLGEVRLEFELEEGEARFSPRRLSVLGLGATPGQLNAHTNTSAETAWPPEAGMLIHVRRLDTLRGSGAVHVLLGDQRLASNLFTGESTKALDVYVRSEQVDQLTVEIEGGDRQKVVLIMHVVRADVRELTEPEPTSPPMADAPPRQEPTALVHTAQPFTIECGPSSASLPQSVFPLLLLQVDVPERIPPAEPGLLTARSPETIRLPVPAGWQFRVDRVQIEGAATVEVDDQTFPPEGVNAANFSARLHGRTFDASSIESFRVQYRDSDARVTIEGVLLLADTETDEPR